ncbi:MAG: hypothetical protein Rubg2KO_26280 [Rubricoccaceae bacterium]
MNHLSSTSIVGTSVKNFQREDLGEIQDLMIDPQSGRVIYAVLDFGGFLGIGDKYFAVPLQAFSVDRVNEVFSLDIDKERLENAPGFDKDNWPTTANESFTDSVYSYYNINRTVLDREPEPVLN